MKKFIFRVKEDAVPIDGVNKTVWSDEDYEEIEVDIPDDELPADIRIMLLKQKLEDTNEIVLGILEGTATAEEYADVLADRKRWREEINELEKSV